MNANKTTTTAHNTANSSNGHYGTQNRNGSQCNNNSNPPRGGGVTSLSHISNHVNSSTINTNANANNTNANNNIEAKIHTLAVSFRQKRDEAYRMKQLSLERLRLIQEEASGVEGTVHEIQCKLKNLNDQTIIQNEIQKLYYDINIMTKEVKITLLIASLFTEMHISR